MSVTFADDGEQTAMCDVAGCSSSMIYVGNVGPRSWETLIGSSGRIHICRPCIIKHDLYLGVQIGGVFELVPR